jgi:cytochrome c553
MRFDSKYLLVLTLLANASWAVAEDSSSTAEFDAAAIEFFEKEVRPVLVSRCYECHSAKSEKLEGGLRLDSRHAAIAGGDTGPAIVPNNPDESLLIDAINYGEVYEMPPKSKMPANEIAVLTKWVALGAPWPQEEVATTDHLKVFDLTGRRAAHWCWQPVRDPTPRPVQLQSRPQRSLDNFILAKLEEAGLTPAAPADKRTLIRRAYFDLIGLPPSPAEVNAFLLDESPHAFEKVLDQLLDSPHFGERWARHWMDLMRYAETYGHEFDFAIPHAHKYRDYLIRALNADVPYDRFVMEHIAGDLLHPPRLHPTEGYNESVIATSSWWLGEATHAPVDVLGDEAGRIDNQIDVFSKAFLGLTVACARCHDHKFDAISTQDYYALAGFLQSSRRAEAVLDRDGKIAVAAAQLKTLKQQADAVVREAYANDDASGEIFTRYLLAAREALRRGSTDKAAPSPSDNVDAARLARWIAALSHADLKERSHPLYAWQLLANAPDANAFNKIHSTLKSESGAAVDLAEQYPRLSGFDDFDGWFVTGDAFGCGLTGQGEWDAKQATASLLRPGTANSGRIARGLQGTLRSPTFTLEHPNIYYRIKGEGVKIRLVVDGYFMDTNSALLFKGFTFDVNSPDKFTWYRQADDVGRYLGHRGYIEVLDYGDGSVEIDEIRFSNEGPPAEPFDSVTAKVLSLETNSIEEVAQAFGSAWQSVRSAHESPSLWNWVASNDLLPVNSKVIEQLAVTRDQMQQVALPSTERVLSLTDGTAENQRIYVRGNQRTLGKEAPRQMLTALVREPVERDSGSGRLQLAQQIVDPSNPLTARVMVNRMWHHLTGRGIVASTDNFGVLGQTPTHPELLDHLAAEFMREGWSVKRMLKHIMLSSTYQMASTPDEAGDARDPQNLLLHRARIRRLQGEVIRDSILAISGRLDPTVFGPSVPIHVTSFMEGRGRPKESGPLDGNGRRSLYIEVRRNFLSPMMLAFDSPIPFSTVGRRNASNVPAQALILMNDPFVVEQAKLWAKRIIADQRTVEARINAMYLTAFSRPPSAEEIAEATAFLHDQAAALGLLSDQVADDEGVWTDLCHVLMNVKEFVFLK